MYLLYYYSYKNSIANYKLLISKKAFLNFRFHLVTNNNFAC